MSELQAEIGRHGEERRQFETATRERLHALEQEIVALKGAQATTRETIRAEMAIAVADLRVRYAEDQLKRSRPELNEGGETPP